MASNRVTQRLAAILAADVAGYSRLMQHDDVETLEQLDRCRGIFREHVTANGGRVESMAGDAVLAIFDTAIGAARAALEIQEALATSTATMPDERKMRFRIGIHLGDIIEKADGTAYGDGVNIAARLESLADAGGIAVSAMVHDSVGRRLAVGFDDLGDHVVKNIADPVHVYRLLDGDDASSPRVERRHADSRQPVEIIAESPLLREVLQQAEAVAVTDAAVLIEGESGVGKELIARHIHALSRRQNGPFIKFDCATVPPELFEIEFFGQSAGELSGANRDMIGCLEAANRGTLLLDNVDDIPPTVQAKLLQPLQDGTFERLGDAQKRQADVRFIATTTSDLTDRVADGAFRRDLYFRLSVFPIDVPPLKARPEDVPALFGHFLCAHGNDAATELSEAQLNHLRKYDWPGNVHELKNIVERAVILSGDGQLRLDDVLPSTSLSYPARAPLPEEQTPARGFFSAAEFEELERNNLIAALEAAAWRIAGTSGAATALGLTPSRLRSRMKALQIGRPETACLYVRLGGHRGIATFARDLFGRANAHPELGRFWRDRSTYGVLREEKLLVAYLSSVAGGPARYVGRDMKASHQHLGITAGDWDIFRDILKTTLEALSVPETERSEVAAFAESLRDDIIQR